MQMLSLFACILERKDKKMKKPWLALMTALCITLCPLTDTVWADELFLPGTAAEQLQAPVPAASINWLDNSYAYSQWAKPINSYLYANSNGCLTRVEQIGQQVVIEDYGNGFILQSQKKLEMELPLWGGFYSGTDYHFLVFGQNNLEEDDQKEVIRVVKYTKDWERVGAASLYAANTTKPFNSGTLRMVQDGDKLYIHTCHEMYTKKEDGVNHQANLTFSVKISNMTIADQNSGILYGTNYVSHSFNQFILMDNSTLLTLDHGDAYPRAMVIHKFKKKNFTKRNTEYCDEVNIMSIKGEKGDNKTGAMIGGFAASSSAYLTVGCSIPQDSSAHNIYNIFVACTPKKRMSHGETKINWITNYTDASSPGLDNPHLVDLGNDRFLLLYMSGNSINYLYLDKDGNPEGSIYAMEGYLSDCVPIFYQGLVVWYYTKNSVPVFCAIDGNGNPYLFQAQ